MDTTYDSYRYAFESCRSYKDEAVNHNDFANICRRYHLNVSKATEAIADHEGRVTLDNFIRYMKHYQQHQRYYDRSEEYRPSSPHPPPPIPPRPHSGSKLHRQAVYASHNYQSRRGVKYPTSPVAGHHDQDDFMQEDLYKRQTLRQELSRTPEHFLSPEDRPGHDRHRPPDQLDHFPTSDYPHTRHSRPSSPPPPLPSHHRRAYNREAATGRSDRARSYKAEESDEDDGIGLYPPPAPSRRPTCKGCKALQRQVQEWQDELKAMRIERERLEQNNERLRKDLQTAQSADLAYAQQLYRDNERLRQELKRLRKDGDPDSDRAYFDRQYEELKRTKDYLEEEIYRLKAYKKECSHLKAEYNAIKLKNEQLQRTNWKLVDENQRLTVKMMEDDKSSLLSRRPGDGGSGEASARSSYASELGFQRQTQLRQTYHSGGVSRDPSSSSRPQRGHGAEMKRTSSAGHVLEYEEPVKESAKMEEYAYSYSRAKSHRSGTSDADATSVVDGIGFSMVSTTPDEQSQVFMVMGEDVSKSVLPEGLPKDKELAMIYALQNCNTIQELIKCLISYGVSTSADKLEGFRVESEQLKSSIEHLRSKNTTLANSFENSKSNMESMYNHVQVVEANNVRLRHALRLCQQACEVFEVLLELRVSESRHSSSNPNYFPSFPEVYNSLESSTRSPDREQVSMKHTVVYKVRSLLHSLDANTELQTYHPGVRTRHGSADYQQTSHWAGSSQNTGTTSGLSSMSGGLDGEVTPNEVERLKIYTQALLLYRNHLVGTLVPVDGLTGLDTVKKGVQETDCATAEHTGQIIDLEDAANAEELCKIREEKAELRSQIYMMEQEKRRMELEVSRMLLHKQKCDKVLKELQFQLKEEKRKRKERKGRRGDAAMPPHDALHMSELSIEYQSALEREKELAKRYEDLFNFLQMHVKDSQCTSEELMRFVKELRRANSALVDAFEKSKKRQQAEKKRMKQELVSYMNRVQNSSVPASDDPPTATIYA